MIRPSWDDYFTEIAYTVAIRADCRRRQVGAVIVRSNRIVATGYNGAPAGTDLSCNAGECPRGFIPPDIQLSDDYSECIAIHAEANAIAYASRNDTEGATIYVTSNVCDMCNKLIAAAGITRIVTP